LLDAGRYRDREDELPDGKEEEAEGNKDGNKSKKKKGRGRKLAKQNPNDDVRVLSQTKPS
jgi:hypothetical protein